MPLLSRIIPFVSLSRPQTIAVLVILLVLIGGGIVVWMQFFQTYHLETVQPGVLYRCGNRGLREFKTALRKTQARTVVSLIDDRELADPDKPQFKQELEFLADQSIRVERIPVKLGGWPGGDDLRKFLDLVSKKENQPVLIHCAQGVRRTGMFVAAFERSILDRGPTLTKNLAPTFGHSRRTVKDIERFIDTYDAKTREMTVQLEMSQE